MLNYKTLTTQLNLHLAKLHINVTNIELFEHAFLHLIGYQFVPEKCRAYYKEGDNNYLCMLLKEPYKVDVNDFITHLKRCVTGKFSSISIQEILMGHNSRNFCANIKIPYPLIEEYLPKIVETIDLMLLDPIKLDFYRYNHEYIKKHGYSLAIINIKYLLSLQLKNYPYADLPEIWSAMAKKNAGLDKNTELRFLQKEIASDIDNFPKVTITLQSKEGGVKKIDLTRQYIVATLANPYSLDRFLTYDISQQEFLIPAIKSKSSKISLSFNEAGNYEVDLGCSGYKALNSLEKFGIEASSYAIFHSAEKNIRYCFYDKENYLRSVLAFKEIKGDRCFNERLHQLTYYIRNNRWEKLSTALDFFLNFKEETAISTDYTGLGFCLFDLARNSLHGEAREKTLSILFKAFERLINKNKVQAIYKTTMHMVLFEICLIKMNELSKSDNKAEKLELQKKLFIHSQQAGLEESNFYLAELTGLKFGNTLKSDVIQDPLAVILELAALHKENSEKNEKLAQTQAGSATNQVFYSGVMFGRK
ncbi:hypothetical protein [Rickettsiella endosymbiont of Dermanyssus gallinae]|uniref:hypothetical protein n=1 Tax=Rickettsiella endosymbiont of Dermanyssus gallinae TaxID=2856608 RepID=UPI001C52BD42|nr:hypothetical protein [Rickettsiella endosymbiont of Dermanyssus gallinae]